MLLCTLAPLLSLIALVAPSAAYGSYDLYDQHMALQRRQAVKRLLRRQNRGRLVGRAEPSASPSNGVEILNSQFNIVRGRCVV